MNRRLASVLIVSIIVVAAAAATVSRIQHIEAHACTAAGCLSGITADLTMLSPDVLSHAANATMCANGTCRTTALWPGLPRVSVVIQERTVRNASLQLTDANGAEVATLELRRPVDAVESQPNGPDCAPTCWDLALTTRDGTLEPSGNQLGDSGTTTR